jgi:hypothetical protein
MIAKLLVSVGIVFYALVVPYLEVNNTHVFNPQWVSHARLHEVWQLATNCLFGVFSIWLVWAKARIKLASMVTFFITGGFLFSYITRGAYGGSMLHSDGTERLLLGINIGVIGFGLAILLTVIALYLDKDNKAL